jgi:DNA-binding transcriptional MerR regulator
MLQLQAVGIREAAEAVGVHVNTLRGWVREIPQIGARRDSTGAFRFGSEALDVLQRIKAFRAEGWPLEDIASHLVHEATPAMTRDVAMVDDTPMIERLVTALQPVIAGALQGDHERAITMVATAREVGRLEERNRALEATVESLKAELEQARAALNRPWWARALQR